MKELRYVLLINLILTFIYSIFMPMINLNVKLGVLLLQAIVILGAIKVCRR